MPGSETQTPWTVAAQSFPRGTELPSRHGASLKARSSPQGMEAPQFQLRLSGKRPGPRSPIHRRCGCRAAEIAEGDSLLPSTFISFSAKTMVIRSVGGKPTISQRWPLYTQGSAPRGALPGSSGAALLFACIGEGTKSPTRRGPDACSPPGLAHSDCPDIGFNQLLLGCSLCASFHSCTSISQRVTCTRAFPQLSRHNPTAPRKGKVAFTCRLLGSL